MKHIKLFEQYGESYKPTIDLHTKKYNDKDYDWFEKVYKIDLDRSKLSMVNDLYTTHYGDIGKAIFKINDNKAHVNIIATKNEERNKGVAKKITNEVEFFCKSKGVELITSNVSENNINSINLHISCGFTENKNAIGRFYDDGSRKLAFYKKIKNE